MIDHPATSGEIPDKVVLSHLEPILGRWRDRMVADPASYAFYQRHRLEGGVPSAVRREIEALLKQVLEPASLGTRAPWRAAPQMLARAVLLAEHDPTGYVELFGRVSPEAPVTFSGFCAMVGTCRAISDDHDLVLFEGRLQPWSSRDQLLVQPQELLDEINRRLAPIADLLGTAPISVEPAPSMTPTGPTL